MSIVSPRPSAVSTAKPSLLVQLVTAVALSGTLGLCIAVSGVIPAEVLMGAVVATALIWRPPLAVAVVLLVASTLGPAGAHFIVPLLKLPVLEVLLAGATGAVVLRLLASQIPNEGEAVRTGALWIPAAAWGICLVALENYGSVTSGIRDAIIFVYPLLIAAPLAIVPTERLREMLDRRMGLVIALGLAVAFLGALSAVTGGGSLTDTGQLRYLGSTFAPALFAGIMGALYLHFKGRLSDLWTLILAGPLAAAFLMVNHRSAYLALIVSLFYYLLIRPGASRLRAAPPIWRLGLLAVCVLFVVLAVTPLGQAGVSRFSSITNFGDPNVQDRLHLAQSATSLHGVHWLVGSGVGQFPTDLAGGQPTTVAGDPGHYGYHDSFVSSLHTGGLIGTVLLIGPMLLSVAAMVRARRDSLVQGFLVLTLFVTIMAASNVFMENAYGAIWVWVPVILGARLASHSRISPRQSVRGHAVNARTISPA